VRAYSDHRQVGRSVGQDGLGRCRAPQSTLIFGSQGVLTANVDNTSTIQVQCTNTTPYNIGSDAGTGSGATVAARKMTNGRSITYSLYSDSGRTTVWGTTIGTNTVSATGTRPPIAYGPA
jgi:spore coat protein U-like protein